MIPLVAILPILLYIGLVIGAQAFQATPARHAPAIVLALVPEHRRVGADQIDSALARPAPPPARSASTKLARQRRRLQRHGDPRRRRGAGRHDARRDRGLHDRQGATAGRSSTRSIASILAFVGLINNPAGLIFQNSGSGWTIVAPNEVWIGYLLGAVVIWAVAYREGHATVAELKAAITTPPDPEPRRRTGLSQPPAAGRFPQAVRLHP